ncbi:MAG: tryptophan synthase subunit alpha [Desulfomonile tiedjei]|nr:tryptophan synthase subunit alpha [Desulfomonile tiedjei]
MKSAIEAAIRRANQQGRCAFIPFLTAGFPDRSTCVEILVELAGSGADVIEVGLPFSDPLADGPTIQSAGKQALDNGVTPEVVLEIVAAAKKRMSAPMVLMTYLNPILRAGTETFAARARKAGVSGVIVPDLPPEEADDWLDAAAKHGLDTTFMIAPTTPLDRVAGIAAKTSGFLYYVSMTGVTGSALVVSNEVLAHMGQVRRLSRVPVAVGFGVSTPEHARTLSEAADGVIVGSALIREVQSRQEPGDAVLAAGRLAASLSAALYRPNGGNVTN